MTAAFCLSVSPKKTNPTTKDGCPPPSRLPLGHLNLTPTKQTIALCGSWMDDGDDGSWDDDEFLCCCGGKL